MNALSNLSRKKSREVAASLPGRFLSRRCFTLCIATEAEPRIAKQYKCHHCCSCKNYRGKGMEGGKKMSLRRFFAESQGQKSRELTTPPEPPNRSHAKPRFLATLLQTLPWLLTTLKYSLGTAYTVVASISGEQQQQLLFPLPTFHFPPHPLFTPSQP